MSFNNGKISSSSSFRGVPNNTTGGLYLNSPLSTQQYHQVGTNNGTGPNTPTTAMTMVHTPYSCQHDLVPTNSMLGSSFHNQNHHDSDVTSNCSRNSATTGMAHQNSDGSFGPGSSVHEIQPSSSFSATKGGSSCICRRSFSEANSTPQPENTTTTGGAVTFDPWGSDNALTMSNSSNTSAVSPHHHHHNYNNTYVEHSSQQPGRGDDNNNYPSFMMRAPIFDTPVHSRHLGGKVEYLEVPTSGAEIPTAAQWNRQHKVFIGHVKFEISADGLRWMVYKLTGIQAGKIEVRGMGCFMVFFNSAEEVFRVRGLHKRVLFDVSGIWFAQNADQESQLQSYAATVAPSVHAKLPKGLMVVDEETSRRRSKKPKNAATVPHVSQKPTEFVAPTPQNQPQQRTPGGFHSHTLTAPPPVQAFAGTIGGRGFPAFSAAEMWAAQRHNGATENYYAQ